MRGPSLLLLLAACGGDRAPSSGVASGTPMEQAIARALLERTGAALTVRCDLAARTCRATALPIDLPVRLEPAGSAGFEWRVDGIVVRADQVEAYVREELAALEVPQAVSCGVRVQVVEPEGRIACKLQHGGVAFVTVLPDGTTRAELDLDPIAGQARSENSDERTLLDMSRRLGEAEDDADDADEHRAE